jgi:hypothetical protein
VRFPIPSCDHPSTCLERPSGCVLRDLPGAGHRGCGVALPLVWGLASGLQRQRARRVMAAPKKRKRLHPLCMHVGIAPNVPRSTQRA